VGLEEGKLLGITHVGIRVQNIYMKLEIGNYLELHMIIPNDNNRRVIRYVYVYGVNVVVKERH